METLESSGYRRADRFIAKIACSDPPLNLQVLGVFTGGYINIQIHLHDPATIEYIKSLKGRVVKQQGTCCDMLLTLAAKDIMKGYLDPFLTDAELDQIIVNRVTARLKGR